MAEETIALIEKEVDLHEATHPHESHEECRAAIEECRARIAALEAEAHRHEEYAEDEGIEVEEV